MQSLRVKKGNNGQEQESILITSLGYKAVKWRKPGMWSKVESTPTNRRAKLLTKKIIELLSLLFPYLIR